MPSDEEFNSCVPAVISATMLHEVPRPAGGGQLRRAAAAL